jgi:hypothetical protein
MRNLASCLMRMHLTGAITVILFCHGTIPEFFIQIFQLHNPEFLAPSNSSRGNFSNWCVLRAAWPYDWRLFGTKNIDLMMVHEFPLQGFNIWAERMKPVKPWQFLSGFFPLYFNFPSVILLLNSSVLVYYPITGNRRRVRVVVQRLCTGGMTRFKILVG